MKRAPLAHTTTDCGYSRGARRCHQHRTVEGIASEQWLVVKHFEPECAKILLKLSERLNA